MLTFKTKRRQVTLAVLILSLTNVIYFKRCFQARPLSEKGRSLPEVTHVGIDSEVSCLGRIRQRNTTVVVSQVKSSVPFLIALPDHNIDTMVSQFIVRHSIWDVHVLKAIELVAAGPCAKGAKALDVGMNVGFFSMAMLAMGCRVSAFELQPMLVELSILSACINSVDKNDFSNRFTVHQGAASDRNNEALRRENILSGNLGKTSILESGGVEAVSMRMDSVESLRDEIAVMKIDVEGHESEALHGMHELFVARQVKNIVLEFSPRLLGIEKAADMLQYLFAFGFRDVFELHYMDFFEYASELTMSPIGTSNSTWATDFSTSIFNYGDRKSWGFTDLLFVLST